MRDDKLAVPISITLEELRHDDDGVMGHELRVGAAGVNQPLVVEIESQFYEWPHVKEYYGFGGIDLPVSLMNALVFKCFELLHPLLDRTDRAHLTLPDATRWIEVQFLDAEAKAILAELRRHVRPGVAVDEGEPAPGMIPLVGAGPRMRLGCVLSVEAR